MSKIIILSLWFSQISPSHCNPSGYRSPERGKELNLGFSGRTKRRERGRSKAKAQANDNVNRSGCWSKLARSTLCREEPRRRCLILRYSRSYCGNYLFKLVLLELVTRQ